LGPVAVVSEPATVPGHFGVWRVLTSFPAMVGSLLLLLVLFGWLGEWEDLLLLGWLASGVAVFTGVGERVAVVAGLGFRRPSRSQAAALGAVWSGALAATGLSAGAVDLYVEHSDDLNAYAAGGRSVAVTTGVLRDFLARRLGSDEVQAVLVHELGHHVTKASRFALVTMWLALPWRAASRFVIGLGLATAGRRQPVRLLRLVVAAVVVVAVVQAQQRGQVTTVLVLSTVSVCAVACPLIDAWVSRRSEYAADRFAATCGVAVALSAALTRLDAGRVNRPSWSQRALSRHPSLERRIDALDNHAAAPVGS
jgi:STE24 endopeptidase